MARTLKIGFVLDDGLDQPDGVQQYVLTLAGWLRGKGHEVRLLAGATSRRDLPGLHVLSRNVAVRFNRNRMTVPLGAGKRQLSSLLANEDFDVLHVQMPYSPQLAGRVITAAPVRTALVGTFHVAPFSWFQRSGARMLALALRPTSRRFDAVVSVSAVARRFALSAFGLDSEVMPNVIDLELFRKQAPRARRSAAKFTMVYLGRLVPRKGCLELLKAAARLEPDLDWRLVICGDGPLRARLQRYTVMHGISERVEFRGFVEETDKSACLAEADIAVFPSLGGESFGIVLLEAMAARAGVVVGGDNEGYRTVLGNWPECLVDPGDAGAFAARLGSLMRDDALRRRLHRAQQSAVKAYDVQVVGPSLLALYERVIAKKQNISII